MQLCKLQRALIHRAQSTLTSSSKYLDTMRQASQGTVSRNSIPALYIHNNHMQALTSMQGWQQRTHVPSGSAQHNERKRHSATLIADALDWSRKEAQHCIFSIMLSDMMSGHLHPHFSTRHREETVYGAMPANYCSATQCAPVQRPAHKMTGDPSGGTSDGASLQHAVLESSSKECAVIMASVLYHLLILLPSSASDSMERGYCWSSTPRHATHILALTNLQLAETKGPEPVVTASLLQSPK